MESYPLARQMLLASQSSALIGVHGQARLCSHRRASPPIRTSMLPFATPRYACLASHSGRRCRTWHSCRPTDRRRWWRSNHGRRHARTSEAPPRPHCRVGCVGALRRQTGDTGLHVAGGPPSTRSGAPLPACATFWRWPTSTRRTRRAGRTASARVAAVRCAATSLLEWISCSRSCAARQSIRTRVGCCVIQSKSKCGSTEGPRALDSVASGWVRRGPKNGFFYYLQLRNSFVPFYAL